MTIERVTVLPESIQQWMNAVVGETLAAGPPAAAAEVGPITAVLLPRPQTHL